MSRTKENRPFQCIRCGSEVGPSTDGSYRNHCPFCLYSLHIDLDPGDRQSLCRGLMQPVGLRQRRSKHLQLVHRCNRCGHVKANRVVEIGHQPDSIDVMVSLPADNDP